MGLFLTGMVLFFGIHSMSIVAGGTRDRLRERLGENGWKGLFSFVAIAGFALLIYGYGVARQSPVVLYVPTTWMRYASLLLILPVFPLLIAAYVPGRIKSVTGHPMLIAVMLWSMAHLLANGSLIDVVLFGGFFAWATADLVSVMHRLSVTAVKPFGQFNDMLVVAIGLVVYAAFVGWLHVYLFGVSVLG
jgi:uncharacterized membrane protein